MEASVSVLARAVELDKKKRYTESAVCYQEGIQLLLNVMKDERSDVKKKGIRDKIETYMSRAEELKKVVEEQKKAGKYHEQIQIDEDSVGHSYEHIVGRFLDKSVRHVEIDDPYIRISHQIFNLLRFCELLKKKCPAINTIILTTGQDEKSIEQQRTALGELKNSLSEHNIHLNVRYSPTLHDRAIRLDSGWIIKIGRGLDYFKPTNGRYSIGYCDMDLRKCHETTINIFHKIHT